MFCLFYKQPIIVFDLFLKTIGLNAGPPLSHSLVFQPATLFYPENSAHFQ